MVLLHFQGAQQCVEIINRAQANITWKSAQVWTLDARKGCVFLAGSTAKGRPSLSSSSLMCDRQGMTAVTGNLILGLEPSTFLVWNHLHSHLHLPSTLSVPGFVFIAFIKIKICCILQMANVAL